MELFWKNLILKMLDQVLDILENSGDSSLAIQSLKIQVREVIQRLEEIEPEGG